MHGLRAARLVFWALLEDAHLALAVYGHEALREIRMPGCLVRPGVVPYLIEVVCITRAKQARK